MSDALAILAFCDDFTFYFTMSMFSLGIIGNFLNLCLFTTLKLFQSNQCAFYLTVESIVNSCQLSILFTINLLPIVYKFDPSNVFLYWCKLRNMLPQTFRLISTSMVCFAAFDQFLSTNPQAYIRQMSTLRLARRLTIVAICLWSLHSIPYGIFYYINVSNSCVMTTIELIRYYSFFYYPVLHGLFPIFVSALFSLLAYRNVRHLVRRQVNVVRRRLDRQLTAMIFARVICFILFLLPYTIYRIYGLNVTVSRANLYPYAIDRLVFTITSAISNFNYSMSFYIFFVSSSRYRRQVKHFLFKKCWRILKRSCHTNPNEIHPSAAISNDHVSDLE